MIVSDITTELTHVELTWREKRIEHWIRFGNIAAEKVLDRRRRVVSFAPGSIFAFVPLTGGSAITAPLAGAFTSDDSIFFVSTAGDNKVHYISIPANPSLATPPTDTQQISPNLPACTSVSNGGVDVGCTFNGSGTIVPATAIAVVPRATT